MITFLGVLIALFAVAMLIIYPFLSNKDVYEQKQDRYNGTVDVLVKKKSHPLLLMFNRKMSFITLALALFIVVSPYLFMFAERGYNYLLVFPSGKMDAIMEQGIKWRGFAKIDSWQKYIDVKVLDDSLKNNADDIRELEGVMTPIPIRFIDQVTANGYVSLRFQLPEDKTAFIELAVKYRTMNNLVNNTIIPTIAEQLSNTGYMFAAQNYISGEAQAFRQTFEESLKDGSYAVTKIEYKDTIYDNSIDQRTRDRRIKEIQTRYDVVKTLENGLPKRIPHELSQNGIIVSQVIVNNIDLERAFKQRLEAQRDESAKRQLEQQKIETAKAAQQRIIAEGERDKASERAVQEIDQVKVLTAIETKLKQEQTNKELAAISLETERLVAQKKMVTADADAYEIKKKVIAGISPEQELKMRLDAGVQQWAEVAKIKFPETMIISDSKGNSGSPLETLIGAAMAKQLTTPPSTK